MRTHELQDLLNVLTNSNPDASLNKDYNIFANLIEERSKLINQINTDRRNVTAIEQDLRAMHDKYCQRLKG